jgi:hypothetical protein
MANGWKITRGLAVAGLVLSCVLFDAPLSLAQGQTTKTPTQDVNAMSLSDPSARNALGAYMQFAKYPPDSRPLTSSSWDLLNPWSADAPSLPMIPQQVMTQVESLRASGMAEEEAWRNVTMPAALPRYQFETNKAILTGIRDELTATLTFTPDPSAGKPLQIHVTKAELIGDDDFGSPRLGSVPVSCRVGGSVCTFHWKAPAAQKEYWGVLTLMVTASVAGLADEFVIRQTFYSSPMVAGKFTGQFQERLENGSLVIDAGVAVDKRMLCFVSANLYSVDNGVPTHHAERRMIVDPSMKTIAFTFFGKIFRDYGHEGLFRLQDLKAACENLTYPPEWFLDSGAHRAELQALQSKPSTTREPSRIYFEYNAYTYTTRRYANSVFSDRDWQSPESARKIEMYKQAATELANPSMETLKQQLRQSQNTP